MRAVVQLNAAYEAMQFYTFAPSDNQKLMELHNICAFEIEPFQLIDLHHCAGLEAARVQLAKKRRLSLLVIAHGWRIKLRA